MRGWVSRSRTLISRPWLSQQARGHACAEQATAQPIAGLAYQHQAGPAFAGVLDQGAGHFAGTQHDHFAAQTLGQLLGGLQALAGGLVAQAAVVHVHQAPRQVAALGNATGMAHQAFGLLVTVHAHQQAPAQGRGLLTALAVAVGEVGIDLSGGGLHGQLAKGGEVGLGEVGVDGRPRLLRHIDLALAQAHEQLTRWEVDQHQLEGFLQDPVRQGLADLNAGDVADFVVEAFQAGR